MDSLLRADAPFALAGGGINVLIPDLNDELYEAARSDFDQARKVYRKAFTVYEALPRQADEDALWSEWKTRVSDWPRRPIFRIPWTAFISVGYATQPDF